MWSDGDRRSWPTRQTVETPDCCWRRRRRPESRPGPECCKLGVRKGIQCAKISPQIPKVCFGSSGPSWTIKLGQLNGNCGWWFAIVVLDFVATWDYTARWWVGLQRVPTITRAWSSLRKLVPRANIRGMWYSSMASGGLSTATGLHASASGNRSAPSCTSWGNLMKCWSWKNLKTQ